MHRVSSIRVYNIRWRRLKKECALLRFAGYATRVKRSRHGSLSLSLSLSATSLLFAFRLMPSFLLLGRDPSPSSRERTSPYVHDSMRRTSRPRRPPEGSCPQSYKHEAVCPSMELVSPFAFTESTLFERAAGVRHIGGRGPTPPSANREASGGRWQRGRRATMAVISAVAASSK